MNLSCISSVNLVLLLSSAVCKKRCFNNKLWLKIFDLLWVPSSSSFEISNQLLFFGGSHFCSLSIFFIMAFTIVSNLICGC